MASGDKQDPFSAATAQLTFHNFLEKMRHPSAVDLVRSIKSFIVSFQASPPDPEKDSASVQQFLAQTEASFRAHPLWAGASDEELDSAGEGLEKYLLTKVFARAFGPTPEDAEVDLLLNARMAALQTFLRPEHLDIPATFGNEPSWLLAQKEVGKLGGYKAPRDKLVCLLNCCRVINNLLLNMAMAAQGDPPGADDFLPVLIYVIIKANPPAFHSNLQFINRYRSATRLVSESAYFFTNAVSAAAFIQHLNSSSLTMDPADFEAKMQHALATAQSSPPPEPPVRDSPNPSEPVRNPRTPPEKAGVLPPRHSRSHSDGGSTPRALQPGGLISSGSSPALATVDVVAGGSVARVPVPPPSPGLTVSAADSASAPLTQPVDTLVQLESHGASGVIAAAESGDLARDYRFLYTSVGDLRVGDVEALLTDYKELVLKYEALARGLQERNAGLARQLNVTADGRASQGKQLNSEGEESLREGAAGERKTLEAMDGMPSDLDGRLANSDGRPTESDGRLAKSDGRPTESDGRRTESDGRPTESDGRRTESDGRPTESDGRRTESDGRPTETDGRPTKSDGMPVERKASGIGQLARRKLYEENGAAAVHDIPGGESSELKETVLEEKTPRTESSRRHDAEKGQKTSSAEQQLSDDIVGVAKGASHERSGGSLKADINGGASETGLATGLEETCGNQRPNESRGGASEAPGAGGAPRVDDVAEVIGSVADAGGIGPPGAHEDVAKGSTGAKDDVASGDIIHTPEEAGSEKLARPSEEATSVGDVAPTGDAEKSKVEVSSGSGSAGGHG